MGPRFLRITDLQNGGVNWEQVPYCTIGADEFARYGLVDGDIVFARTGATTGKSYLVEEPPEAVCASYLIRVRLLDSRLLPRFVSLYFQTDAYWSSVKQGSTGSAQGGFNASKLSSLLISIPPLSEQRRIVNILDEAFEGIATAKANAEKNLQNAGAVFESRLESIFSERGQGWVERPIGECFKVKSGDFLPASAMASCGQIPVYGGNGINGAHDKRNLTGDNIVIGRVGAKCGNVRRVLGDAWVTDNALLISEYLHPFDLGFLTLALTRMRLRNTANHSAQPVISYSTIKSEIVHFPASKLEQATVAEELHALAKEAERLSSIYNQKLASLDELKKSLLHRAFSGDL